MGFKMNCDRCGRFIRNISMSELKKQTDFGKEIICPQCSNWEKRSRVSVEKAVERMKGDLEKYRIRFVEKIKQICEESMLDPELVAAEDEVHSAMQKISNASEQKVPAKKKKK